MKVDNRGEDTGQLCPKTFVKPVQSNRGMDDHGYHRPPCTSRRSPKSKAPPPPPASKSLDGSSLSHRHPGYPHTAMDQKENLLDQELTLVVVLPEGVEKTAIVHGSKPMMDLLVMLCAKYHLNPSGHTIELVSTNRNHIKFKPNALIGALEAEKILLKPKGMEDKNKKPGPQMPEATVRLIINYKKTQKTILRVNPRVPLEELLPSICEKCEFELKTTILLRNVHSEDPLDLSNSLNDFGLREVYARDMKGISPVDLPEPPSPTHSDIIPPSKDKIQKEKENKGMFRLFKRSKKKPDQATTASAPVSPVLRKPRPVSMTSLSARSPTYDSNTMPSDMPKKRRAPLPPAMMPQSTPSDLSDHQGNSQPEAQPDGNQDTAAVSQGSSSEACLKRAKRKAPPPPSSVSAAAQDEAPQDRSSTGVAPPSPLEEIQEQEEMLDLSADVSADSGVVEAPSRDAEVRSASPGEDPPCDRSSDGKLADGSVNHEECADQTQNATALEALQESGDDVFADSAPDQAEENSEQTGLSAENATTAEEICESSAEPSESSLQSKPESPDSTGRASQTGTWEEELQALIARLPGEDEPEGADGDAACTTEAEAHVGPTSPPEEPAPAEPSPSAGLKRDTATSTEEPGGGETQPASSRAADAPQCRASARSAPAATGAPLYITEAEPKPKPSNELTRDYIPKVGMTTYTIVPHKSLEKLRFFEVALTLETQHAAERQGAAAESAGRAATTDESPGRSDRAGACSSAPGAEPQLSNGTAVPGGAECGGAAELIRLPPSPASPPRGDDAVSSPSAEGAQAGLAAEVKEKKVPPATKPKPASFRLPQHKRTPGYYVTSAAGKSTSAGAGGPSEAPGSPAKAQSPRPAGESSFPPPPPAVRWEDEAEAAGAPAAWLTRQTSLPSRQPTPGLSLEKLQSFAAPRPYSPGSPSRFAQAVSSAVKRSQSLTRRPAGLSPHTLPLHPLAGRSPIKELTEPSKKTVTDNGERKEDKGAEVEGEDDLSCGPGSGTPVREAGRSDAGHSGALRGDDGPCENGADLAADSDASPSAILTRRSPGAEPTHEE